MAVVTVPTGKGGGYAFARAIFSDPGGFLAHGPLIRSGNCDLNPHARPPMHPCSSFRLPLPRSTWRNNASCRSIGGSASERANTYSPLQDKYPAAEVDIRLVTKPACIATLQSNTEIGGNRRVSSTTERSSAARRGAHYASSRVDARLAHGCETYQRPTPAWNRGHAQDGHFGNRQWDRARHQ
jgi:hypothetical protein